MHTLHPTLRFHPLQLVGAALVISGVILAVLPPSSSSAVALSPTLPNVELKCVSFLISLLCCFCGYSDGLRHCSNLCACASMLHSPAPLARRYVLLVVACFSLPALASTLKDKIFRDEAQRIGRSLDIFVVNSFGSAFQALFVVFLLLPVTTALAGVPLTQLPEYLAAGRCCHSGLLTLF